MQRTAARELRNLFALSTPIALSQVGQMTMGVVDTMMVARIGVSELAAVAISSTWVWSSGSSRRASSRAWIRSSRRPTVHATATRWPSPSSARS